MSRTRQPAEPHIRTASVRFDVGNTWRRHGTSWAQLIFATRGAVTVHTGEGMWVVPPQRALYVPPSLGHDVEVPSGVTLRTLYLRRPLRRELPNACQAIHVSPLLRELLRRAFQLDTLDRRVRAERNLIEVLFDQLTTLPLTTIDLPMPRDARALRAASRIRAAPDAPNALDDVARDAGASVRTLERIFREETGLSFGAWRQRARLARALQLLAEDATVTQAAVAVGYESVSAFVAAFRRTVGVTPGQYFRTTRA
jgi:AraC-like DNA-binding protein